jgi:hypothetical protein
MRPRPKDGSMTLGVNSRTVHCIDRAVSKRNKTWARKYRANTFSRMSEAVYTGCEWMHGI